MPILILSPETAAKIAAGEVVERPASVVKELVENALDAGATSVTIEIEAGGTRLIRVADDGCGIPVEEVEVAFQRHATSKLQSAADLSRITTLGFRGEALPSIAAVARVSILTRTRDNQAGAYMEIAAGASAARSKRACPPGTTVTVRDLFYTVPARRKFLKSMPTEAGHISQLVTQYSLAYPGVRFTLAHDGRKLLSTPGNGSLRDAILSVYGLEVADAMLELHERQDGPVVVTGFVSQPTISRTGRGYLSFFVNRRWVQSRMLAYAVEEAYQGLLMVGRHPMAIVNVALPPSDVDINIHPAKTEVRFLNEREVFSAVQRSVRAALVRQAPVPTFQVTPQRPSGPAIAASLALFGPPVAGRDPPSSAPALTKEESSLLQRGLPALRLLGQVNASYIVAEGPEGIYLVDQHAAHERVLYERLREQRARQQVEVQGLLEPLLLELTPAQDDALSSRSGILAEYGFQVESFGDRACLVRAAPASLATRGLREALLEILDRDISSAASAASDVDAIAISVACHSAVRAGQTLSNDEMRELLRSLEAASSPQTCPHGRPTMLHLSSAQLETQFGRRG